MVVHAVNMPNVSGELRDIFQMACFSRGMTFLTRLHSEGDGLMVSQNVKRTTFEKVPKCLVAKYMAKSSRLKALYRVSAGWSF